MIAIILTVALSVVVTEIFLTVALSVVVYGVALLSDAISARRRARRHATWLASFYERER